MKKRILCRPHSMPSRSTCLLQFQCWAYTLVPRKHQWCPYITFGTVHKGICRGECGPGHNISITQWRSLTARSVAGVEERGRYRIFFFLLIAPLGAQPGRYYGMPFCVGAQHQNILQYCVGGSRWRGRSASFTTGAVGDAVRAYGVPSGQRVPDVVGFCFCFCSSKGGFEIEGSSRRYP